MLLAAGVQVAGVDDRQRRGALAVLAQALGQQLIVPEADRLQAFAPGREDADGRSAADFHQPSDAGIVQDRVLARRRACGIARSWPPRPRAT